MKVQKSKYSLHYNVGLVFIGILFLYIFISQNLLEKDFITASTLLLILSGLLAGIRAFHFDRLRRLTDNKDLVNFWKYFDDTDYSTIGIDYFMIIPILRKFTENHAKQIKFRINILTGLIYLIFIAFIWTQIGRSWHYL